MACYAPNTPLPTSSTQIGYSVIHVLNTASTSTTHLSATMSTYINTVPIGVWSLSGYVTAEGQSNRALVTQAYANVSTDQGILVSMSGLDIGASNTNPFVSILLPFTGVFYSAGNLNLTVQLLVRSSSTTICNSYGSIVLTKIA